jgi:CubicO group peptidase (beta-lactamase class C family)
MAAAIGCGLAGAVRGADVASEVFPAEGWDAIKPADAGLAADRLDALAGHVGGDGCVVRRGCLVFTWGDPTRSGDVASAFKPLLSTLLMIANQEGKLKGPDDRVADVEPRLKTINGGKDAAITWRHLAYQTSGYGLVEKPGEAFSYNDFALALYYDSLTRGVFKEEGTALLERYFAKPLGFADRRSWNAFGPKDRPGRLAVSVRDFARLGLMIQRGGRWREGQLVRRELVEMMTTSPLPADTPLTSGKEAEMIPGQRSIGGGKNITDRGPGYYSFNWWLNRKDKIGRPLYADLPADAIIASGHGPMRELWILPGLDLIVCWNNAKMRDGDREAAAGAAKIVSQLSSG